MANQDRITHLPDDLLRHILSFLPTNEVAATAVLSHEWHRISRLLSSLEIDFSLNNDEESEARLDSFTDGILLHAGRPLHLHKLVVRFPIYENPHPIARLLEVAVGQRHVRCLEIDMEYDDIQGYFTLPQIVYTSLHLQELTIRKVRIVPAHPAPNGHIFPALHILKVDISVPCPTLLQWFYTRCPILEELSLVGDVEIIPGVGEKRRFQLYSQSLRRLTIKIDSFDEMGGHEDKGPEGDYDLYTFVIDAPRLEILSIDEDLLASYQVRDLSSVVEATIQVGWQDVSYHIPAHGNVNNIFTLLRGLTHVQRLTLHDRTLGVAGYLFENYGNGEILDEPEVWALFREAVPIFPSLNNITVCISHRFGWKVLPYLLDRTPAVEVLAIEMVIRDNVTEGDRYAWDPPIQRPGCLTRSIQEVQLRGFQGNDELLAVVEYFQQISATIREFDIIIT